MLVNARLIQRAYSLRILKVKFMLINVKQRFLEGDPKALKAEDGVLRFTRGGTEVIFFPSFAWH